MASFTRTPASTRWMADRAADRRRARRSLLSLLAAALLVVALGVVAVVRFLLPGAGDTGTPSNLPSSSTIRPSTLPDVTWRPIAGVDLPFSRSDGPRILSDGQAAGYSKSGRGAALAAVQVLIRTSATAGPAVFEPVLAAQVTGVNAAAMKLAVADAYRQLRAGAGVPDGAPVPGRTGTVIGYQVADYRAATGTAAVDVVLTSADLSAGDRHLAFRVELLWQGEDWRAVAPPGGNWGSVARTVAELSPLLRRYGGGR